MASGIPVLWVPGLGHYARMYVYVPDRPAAQALLGPYPTAGEARQQARAAERGVLHLGDPTS